MSYEEKHIEALHMIAGALGDLRVQMQRAEANRLQRHTQLLATLRTLEPKERQGE